MVIYFHRKVKMNGANRKTYKGEILLLIAALIWGSSYIFQKMGMDYVGPFTFGFFRFCIGALALVPVIFAFDRRKQKKGEE